MISEVHRQYLRDRSIDPKMAEVIGVKSDRDRLVFPYPNYRKMFTPGDKAATRAEPTGVPHNSLWQEDRISQLPVAVTDVLIITEGEYDALAVMMTKIQNARVVSLPDGVNSTKALLEDDGKLKKWIEPYRRIIVFTDGDQAGVKCRDEIIAMVGEQFCYVIEYPQGCKDANDIALKHGIDGLRDIIKKRVPSRHDSFISLMDVEDEEIQLCKKLSIQTLRDRLVFGRPDFTVIGGESGHGKSTIAQLILFDLIKQNPGLKASIFHGEGFRTIVKRRALKFANGDQGWVRDNFALIRPAQDEMPTFDWLLWAMERHALDYGHGVFMVDPWNEIMHTRDVRKSMTDHVGECIIKMKRLADRLGLILIVVHHVAKPKEPGKKPERYALADSAHWVNKADHVVMVWRDPEEKSKVSINIAKSKDHSLLGIPGDDEYRFNEGKFQLYSLTPMHIVEVS